MGRVQQTKEYTMRKVVTLFLCLTFLALPITAQKSKPKPKPDPKPAPAPAPVPITGLPAGLCGTSNSGQYAAVFYGRGADPSRPEQAILFLYAATQGVEPADRALVSFDVAADDIRQYESDGYSFLVINSARLNYNPFVGYPVAAVEVEWRFSGSGLVEGSTGAVMVRYRTDANLPQQDFPGNPIRERRDFGYVGFGIVNRGGCY
jgi:hypothetical protein